MVFSAGLSHQPQFPRTASFVASALLRAWFSWRGQWPGECCEPGFPRSGEVAGSLRRPETLFCFIHSLYRQNCLKPFRGFQRKVSVSLLSSHGWHQLSGVALGPRHTKALFPCGHRKGLHVASQEPGKGQSLLWDVQGLDLPSVLSSPFTAHLI